MFSIMRFHVLKTSSSFRFRKRTTGRERGPRSTSNRGPLAVYIKAARLLSQIGWAHMVHPFCDDASAPLTRSPSERRQIGLVLAVPMSPPTRATQLGNHRWTICELPRGHQYFRRCRDTRLAQCSGATIEVAWVVVGASRVRTEDHSQAGTISVLIQESRITRGHMDGVPGLLIKPDCDLVIAERDVLTLSLGHGTSSL